MFKIFLILQLNITMKNKYDNKSTEFKNITNKSHQKRAQKRKKK